MRVKDREECFSAMIPARLPRLTVALKLPLIAAVIGVIAFCGAGKLNAKHSAAGENPNVNLAVITVDYPFNHTLFPPDLAPPTFQWRDADTAASIWGINVSFAEHASEIEIKSNGERMQIGPIDERCAKAGAVPPTLTPEQAAGHSWKPEAATWEAILRHSVKKPATVTITGYADESMAKPLSRGQITIQTSKDPVGAPIFFRDVPLISVPTGEKGVIMPIPTAAVPFIAWRLRYVGENQSRLMMQGLPHLHQLPLLLAKRSDHGPGCRWARQ